ncbi:MAG: uridine kinase [Coprothermobacter proteolyticus]|uniref:uridine kinase n=1 Tax=Coprothermobacter proteolyticus TaxID=35786 RepID=UPI000D31F506|nr:uridine kinase [Coprothermobacter proteolyticus]
MQKKYLLLGIAGGTGSGKTTVAKTLHDIVPKDQVTMLSMDSYYRDFPNLSLEERRKLNYDHPNAFDFDLLYKHLQMLIQGESIKVPEYSFELYGRTGNYEIVVPRPVIIVEGILLFYDERIRNLFDIKIYVDTDADVRILRRLKRDVEKRGRTLDSVIKQYLETVRPMHIQFVEPTKRFADIIVPEGGKNMVAMDIIKAKIQVLLQELYDDKSYKSDNDSSVLGEEGDI